MGGYGYGMGMAREAMIPLAVDPGAFQRGMGGALSLAQLLQQTDQQRQIFPGQMELQRQRIQANQMALDQQRQQQVDEQTFRQALLNRNGDWGSALNDVAGRVSPSYSQAVMGQFAKAQDQLANWSKEQRAQFQDKQTKATAIYNSLMQMQGPAFSAALPQAQRSLADVDPRYAQMIRAGMTPDQLRAGLGLALGVEDKLLSLKPGETTGRVSPTGQFTPTYTAPAAPQKLDDQQQYIQDWLATRGLANTPANRQRAFADYNKQTKVEPGVARMQILLQRPTQVADPNNPGETVMVPQSQAVGMAGPSSASVQNPRAMGRYMTSGKGGQQLAMFDTAIGHAQQLGNLVDALGNGNVRLLNQIGNRLGLEMGSDAVTNFNVVKTALGAEVERLFAGGVASEGDRRNMAGLISASNSPQQLRGAINQVVHLMQSRKQALQKQYQAGMQGQPSFGDNAGGAPADPSDPLGILPGRKR